MKDIYACDAFTPESQADAEQPGAMPPKTVYHVTVGEAPVNDTWVVNSVQEAGRQPRPMTEVQRWGAQAVQRSMDNSRDC